MVFDNSELGNSTLSIPLFASPPTDFGSSRAENLLRYHFYRCLHVHFCGGDIRSQYTNAVILNLMERLNIAHSCVGDAVSLSDSRWHDTELGRALLQSHLEGEIVVRRRR